MGPDSSSGCGEDEGRKIRTIFEKPSRLSLTNFRLRERHREHPQSTLPPSTIL